MVIRRLFCKVRILAKTGFTLPELIVKYLHYLLKAKSGKGFGIHSPQIYDFARKVLYNETRLKVPDNVEKLRRSLRSDRSWIGTEEQGAGSRLPGWKRHRVSQFAKHASVGKRYGALLYRMVKWFQPEGILELGTGIGVSTLYLSSGFSGRLVSVEADEQKSQYAREMLLQAGIRNPELHCGLFDDLFEQVEGILQKRCLVFLDGDHRFEAVTALVERILARIGDREVLIVLDDIHWSSGMEKAWRQCIANTRCTYSVDLFRFGLLFVRENPVKQHFTLFF